MNVYTLKACVSQLHAHTQTHTHIQMQDLFIIKNKNIGIHCLLSDQI
jgi:hypothetical protein